MEDLMPTSIPALKDELELLIEKNNYDLLSPEVIKLSEKLDSLIVPLFKRQLTSK